MNRTTERRSRALAGLLVLALVSTGATALATDVRGALRPAEAFGRPAEPSAEEAARDRYWDEWNGVRDPEPRGFDVRRDVAVVLTGPGDLAADQPGFEIAGGGLWPTTLVHRTGGNLEILNTDPVAHQLYAEGFEEFTATPTSPGLTRRVPTAAAGSWPLRDQVYGHVRGHLHVIDDLVARATIAEDGTYRFTNVPPGTYTLKIFHGADVVHTQEGVVVEERELTLEPISLAAAGG